VPAADIERICAQLGLMPRAAQTAALVRYLELLQRWNATYNLTAVRDPEAMLTQHLADCLAVIPPLQRRQGRAACSTSAAAAGCRGGDRGVAAGWDVTCVDAVAKKAAFVRQVAGALALPNLHAVHTRVEGLKAPPFDVVTSRAFASLADFVALTRRHLALGCAWMAMKGRVPEDEIAALPADIDVFHVEPLHVPGLDAQRCLVWMQGRWPGREVSR